MFQRPKSGILYVVEYVVNFATTKLQNLLSKTYSAVTEMLKVSRGYHRRSQEFVLGA